MRLIGVEFGVIPGSFGQYQREESDGSSEFDTLIGGSGRDTFALSLSLLELRRPLWDYNSYRSGGVLLQFGTLPKVRIALS